MRWKTMRRWMTCLLTAALAFSAAPAVLAAPGQVRLEAAPGWGGEYKGDFVPVRVKIASGGEAVSGKVTVRLPQSVRWGVKPRAVPTVPVELPAGTEKQVTLVLSKYLARPDVQVAYVSDGQVIAETPVGGKRLSANDRMVGVLSEDPQAAGRLAGMLVTPGSRIRTVPVQVSEIPESGRALDGMDVLVVHRLGHETLTPAQAEAVRQWVHAGGTLLVTGAGGSDAVRGLEAVLPVRLEAGTVRVNDLTGLSVWGKPPAGPILSAKSRPAEGVEVLAEGNGTALLAERTYGMGKVMYAGFDPLDPAVAGWEGNRRLWEEELLSTERIRSDDPGMMFVFGDQWLMTDALNQMPHLRLPSVGWLAAAFLIYAMMVGPAAFWVLARIKKREWNWLLVPLAGVLMSGGLYVYGTILRGDAVLVHQIGFVEAADGKTGQFRGMASILSQNAGDYDVTLKGAFAWPSDPGNVVPGTDLTVKEVTLGRDATIHFPDIPQWSKRDLLLEGDADLGGDLGGTAVAKGDEWIGKVTNRTRYPVRKATVLIDRTPVVVGDLAPGENREFRVRRTKGIQPMTGPFSPDQLGYRYTDREYKVLEHLFVPYSPTRLEGTDVFGWIDTPLAEVEVKDHRVKSAGLFLINGKIRIAADESGQAVIPFGAIRPEVVRSDEPVQVEWMNDFFSMERGGEVILEYPLGVRDLNEIRKVRVERFAVDGFLYDWQAKKWVPANRVENYPAGSLVSHQRVRVKLQVPDGKGEIEIPLIEVEGSVKP